MAAFVRHSDMCRSRDDEEQLTADLIELARQYGRYGDRKIAGPAAGCWLGGETTSVSERIWRREGLKVPAKQPKRGRLCLNEGSCVRLRPERANHVWSYDSSKTARMTGRKIRMPTFSTSSPMSASPSGSLVGSTRQMSFDVLSGPLHPSRCARPRSVRHGPEFIAKAVQDWITAVGAKTRTSHPVVVGRTAMSRASTLAFATNFSMARSSTACARRRSSSKAGGVTTTRSGRMDRSATGRQHLKCSCQPLPLGRLRLPDLLRRPSYRWCRDQP